MALSQKTLLRTQAAYYVATGVWPLLSMRLFEAATGKKTDHWLVQTVGLLVTCIGATIAVGTRRRRKRASRSVITLAVSSALSLAAIETIHVFRRRISPIYLADALVEVSLVLALLGERGSFPSD